MSDDKKGSCCPDGSWPALATDTNLTGTEVKIGEMAAYESGDAATAKRAMLCIPDIFGVDSGRTKAIADQYAQCGFFAIVPDVLLVSRAHWAACLRTKCRSSVYCATFKWILGVCLRRRASFLRTGDDTRSASRFARVQGDPMVADDTVGEKIEAWAKSKRYLTVVKPRIVEAMAHIKSKGFKTMCVSGYCWGVWVAFKMMADGDVKEDLSAAVGNHPSLQIEGFHDGSAEDMATYVTTPTLLCSCANDQPYVKSDGKVAARLTKNGTPHKVIDFEQQHGFVNRGDVSDDAVRADVKRAIEEGIAFCTKYCPERA
eukprot:TRINITY_DN1168_c0_g3_i1.p1 TRINITY_DN1168_c0_g3~~TRINITY_DN1168_c0_g3_i1.p1  ORF type:complete len:338 (-),score=83.75 TRINITY_DN1168_c0_g3_i1:56-1000(-)